MPDDCQYPSQRRVQLRRYSNRRYYDATRSRHMTLGSIHRLILDGYNVVITDSKTDEDLTARVLAQILLERDATKLAILPIELLHQILRANEPLIRDFVDKYFSGALKAFLESQRRFEQYLREALALETPAVVGENFARLMLGPLAQSFFASGGRHGAENSSPPTGSDAPPSDLRTEIDALRQQVDSLQQELRSRVEIT